MCPSPLQASTHQAGLLLLPFSELTKGWRSFPTRCFVCSVFSFLVKVTVGLSSWHIINYPARKQIPDLQILLLKWEKPTLIKPSVTGPNYSRQYLINVSLIPRIIKIPLIRPSVTLKYMTFIGAIKTTLTIQICHFLEKVPFDYIEQAVKLISQIRLVCFFPSLFSEPNKLSLLISNGSTTVPYCGSNY